MSGARLRLSENCLCRINPCALRSPLPGRHRHRYQGGDHLPIFDLIALMQLNPKQPACDRRRDDVTIMRADLPVFVNRDLQRTTCDAPRVHCRRRRPERVRERHCQRKRGTRKSQGLSHSAALHDSLALRTATISSRLILAATNRPEHTTAPPATRNA